MIRRCLPVELREGAGAWIRRLFPTVGQPPVDPFVLLDEFTVVPPAHFPEHPHKGFEAVTFLVEGGFRHRDNLGHDSVVGVGGAQRFTAGRGIIHAEYPVGERVRGLQLWVTLPQALKQVEPSYQVVEALPWYEQAGIRQCVIVGDGSPLRLETPVEYFFLELAPGATGSHPIEQGWKGFAYVLEGAVRLNDIPVHGGEGVILEEEAQLEYTTAEGARLVVGLGRPWHEPIRLVGSFVL